MFLRDINATILVSENNVIKSGKVGIPNQPIVFERLDVNIFPALPRYWPCE